MPLINNAIGIGTVTAAPGLIQSTQVARSVDLARIQYVAQLQGDATAPHFAPPNEPVGDGRAFPATNGKSYYRPLVRVAMHAGDPAGPEVRFLKDAQGGVSLHFDLEEDPVPSLPAGAEPFNVRVDGLNLLWQPNHRWDFDKPLLLSHDTPGDGKPHFTIRVGVDVPGDRVEELYGALSDATAGASLQVTLSFGYWLEQPVESPPPPPPAADPGGGRMLWPEVMLRPGLAAAVAIPVTGAAPAPVAAPVGPSSVMMLATAGNRAIVAPGTANFIDLVRARGGLDGVATDADQRRQQPNYRAVTLARSLPFTYRPDQDQNRPIYAALKAADSLPEAFHQVSPTGDVASDSISVVARAPFPNTIYRLPDEVRLAFSDRLGVPHVIPMVHRDGQGHPRVAVTFMAVPWHNPARLVALRDWLYRESAGALAAPDVVVGGYKDAKLHLTTAFPSDIQVLGGDNTPVPLETGFELTLDLTLEYYKFLCSLLTGPPGGGAVGLTGQVTVTTVEQPPAGAGGQPVEKLWNLTMMNLNLQELAALPIDVQTQADALSPTQVTLLNRAHAPVSIDGCVPLLLQVDRNSVVPLAIFPATTKTAFPAELPADGSLTVVLEPGAEAKGQLWNAVMVQLLGVKLAQPAQQVLDRIHEIAPAGALDWVITAECPPFEQTPTPSQFQSLFKVDVTLSRTGFADQRVTLGRDHPTAQIHMQQTLRDLLLSAPGSVQSFQYSVRNIYNEHMGAWSPQKTEEGDSLVVFPNRMENDVG